MKNKNVERASDELRGLIDWLQARMQLALGSFGDCTMSDIRAHVHRRDSIRINEVEGTIGQVAHADHEMRLDCMVTVRGREDGPFHFYGAGPVERTEAGLRVQYFVTTFLSKTVVIDFSALQAVEHLRSIRGLNRRPDQT